MPKYCPECGYKLEKETKYCPECGKNLLIEKVPLEEKSSITLKKKPEEKTLYKRTELIGFLLVIGMVLLVIGIVELYVNPYTYQSWVGIIFFIPISLSFIAGSGVVILLKNQEKETIVGITILIISAILIVISLIFSRFIITQEGSSFSPESLIFTTILLMLGVLSFLLGVVCFFMKKLWLALTSDILLLVPSFFTLVGSGQIYVIIPWIGTLISLMIIVISRKGFH